MLGCHPPLWSWGRGGGARRPGGAGGVHSHMAVGSAGWVGGASVARSGWDAHFGAGVCCVMHDLPKAGFLISDALREVLTGTTTAISTWQARRGGGWDLVERVWQRVLRTRRFTCLHTFPLGGLEKRRVPVTVTARWRGRWGGAVRLRGLGPGRHLRGNVLVFPSMVGVGPNGHGHHRPCHPEPGPPRFSLPLDRASERLFVERNAIVFRIVHKCGHQHTSSF